MTSHVLAHPISTTTTHRHHGPFHAGDHVTVKKFGDAIVQECPHTEYSNRVQVAYPDGSTYHCFPSRLVKKIEVPTETLRPPPSQPHHVLVAPPQTYVKYPAGPQTTAPVVKAPFFIGERVMVKGYGLATVVGLPTEGRYIGRAKVQYPDKSTYHCFQAELLPYETTAHKRHHVFRVGEVVHVKNYGDATVIDLPMEGKYAGRVRVRYDDMSTYHCWRHELEPYFTDSRMPVSVAPGSTR